MIRNSGHLRGRPTGDGGVRSGSSKAHSASVKSVGKASSARAYCDRTMAVDIVDIWKSVVKYL